ncbi:putative ribonuclease H-like domain-containing protein [Tanacetum coccineum]
MLPNTSLILKLFFKKFKKLICHFTEIINLICQRMTHPHPKGNFVPKAVLMKSGIKTLNIAGQNFSKAAVSVNTARPILPTQDQHNLNEKVNKVKGNVTTAGPKAVVSNNKGNEANDVKALPCWVWIPKQKVLDHGNPQLELQEKRVIDSGCSRHVTGNKAYLSDYEEIDGGFVAFRGDPKGGKIIGKGKISTCKLDFEDVYFVKELKFNLFSVLQMCDKKNNVLFTDTECVVLSPDFKLLDENHVLLRVPRKDNMYSVDLKNIVPSGGLTCLFAKATLDESNLWHRRLGHINFKTMNKLVRGNLVRGLPSKIFENNHTCVACQKGKQHKASCKTKTVSSISQPLQMLHMDLFGPTFVKSLMKKMYCLVVTDDYSRFSWVFFLATKDETSEILKTFITGIENLIDLKVKVIRCDNGTEFKNKVMNQFCEMKGKAKNENRPGKDYILLPFFTQDPSFSSSLKDSLDAGFKPSGEKEKKDAKDPENEDSKVPNTEEPRVNQEHDANVNSTNNNNTISPTVNAADIENNVVDENIVYGCDDDPNMPNLEEIVYSDDDEGVDAKADMTNLDTHIFVNMDAELVKGSKTKAEGSSKRAREELESNNSKKQRIDEHVEAKGYDDQEEAEMKKTYRRKFKMNEVGNDAIL